MKDKEYIFQHALEEALDAIEMVVGKDNGFHASISITKQDDDTTGFAVSRNI